MYEAAIKTASTGVYFAVPYMAKLIIEFMEKNYQKENRNLRKSRDLLVERILHRYPARRVDSDDDLFDALEEYDSYRNERYERLADDQSKLCKLFMSNPKMGAFISDVIGGEDALIACVRYFGKDMLDCAEDEGRMEEVRKANDEYLSRMARFDELENQMRENLKNSTRCMERFKSEKGMSDEEFESFLDRVYHLCNHVFMGELNDEVLGLLFKGLYYDRDLSCAERDAEVRGRNERIVFEKRERNGDSLPPLRNGGSFEPDSDLSPVFGNRRRRSVWDL